MALIAGGLPGIIAGAFLSLLILLLGKNRMQKAVLHLDIPLPMRKLVPKNHFRTRLEALTEEVKENLTRDLASEKSDALSGRIAREISQQIEECLIKMAEIVEIPLG